MAETIFIVRTWPYLKKSRCGHMPQRCLTVPSAPDVVVGLRCESAVDECLSQPCQNNGSCTDLFNGFLCDCPPGFNGSHSRSKHNFFRFVTGYVLISRSHCVACTDTNYIENEVIIMIVTVIILITIIITYCAHFISVIAPYFYKRLSL